MSEKITIGGRRFVRVSVLTVAQDEYFTQLLFEAGVKDPEKQPGEDLSEYSVRIFKALLETGTLRPMLACMIAPADSVRSPRRGLAAMLERWRVITPLPRATGWSPDVARETAEFLGEITEPRDKERLYQLVHELLIPFYRSGLSSWARSLTSGSVCGADESPASASSPAPAPATGGA